MTANIKNIFLLLETSFHLEMFFRMILASVLGCIVGFERKNRDKNAGSRTHAIVCLGSALIMLVSQYGFSDVSGFDGSRVAAQIVSGVGFLGAGIMFVKNNTVSGVTTAAGIWTIAGIGMAIGAGNYFLGISATVLIIAIQFFLHRLSIFKGEPYWGHLKIITSNYSDVINDLQTQFQQDRIRLINLKINKEKKNTEAKLEFDLLYPPNYSKNDFLIQWSKDERINSITG